MANTQTVREWYPEPLGGDFVSPFTCNHKLESEGGYMATVLFPTSLTAAGVLALKVHAGGVEYWRAFTAVMRHHGVALKDWDGGTINCRTIAKSSYSSLHAHGCAFDLLPDTFPQAFINDVLAIRTQSGLQVFRHPLPVSDRMHFQNNVPQHQPVDWSTVAGDNPMPTHEHIWSSNNGPNGWGDIPWGWYLEEGFSSVPDSRVWEARREDLAYVAKKLHDKYVAPLQTTIKALEARVAELEAAPPGGGWQETRVAGIESDIAELRDFEHDIRNP